ncbi:hypothetical protein D3C78_1165590 [compost metagenome]
MPTCPVPSKLPGRLSSRTTWLWLSDSSAVSSMVTMRSRLGMKLARALSSEVLPELVPPLTRMLQRACTAISRMRQISVLKVPSLTRSCGVSGSLRNLRMDTEGPSMDSGAMMTLMRPPSGRRASTMGLDSSRRRPSGARMRRTMRITCSSSLNCEASRCSMPPRET